MHVLYFHQYFCPPDGSGGTRSYEMARRLVTAGHKVTLITSSAFFPEHYALKRITRLTLDGVDLIVLSVPYSNHMGYGRRLWAFLKFAIGAAYQGLKQKGVDVVFATSTPLTIIIPGYIASRVKAAPLVFEVRDLWPDLPIAIGALSHPLARWLARRLERFAYRASQRLIALSPGMKDGIRRHGIVPEHISVIPNASDVDLFRVGPARAEQFLESRPHLNGKPLVVYGGTLGRINNVGYLVDIAAEMLELDPEVRFFVCGDGGDRDNVHNHAKARGVLDVNFFMEAPLPKAEMPDLLSAASVCVSLFQDLPEMRHNSANKVFDALAAGRPLAVNYGGWQAELLESRGAGIALPAKDTRAAASELADFLNDRDGLRRAGEQAAALAESRFNRERLAGEFRMVLEDAVLEDPAPERRRRRTLRLKRTMDILAATVGLIVLSPLLIALSLLILFKMGRPVFFSQKRPGYKSKPFRILKFRTMSEAAPGETATADSERLTPLGRFLRRTSLDELPELINVLIGDMSLVGPRPLLMDYLPYYSDEQSRRHDVRPGITGYAQVHGRNALSWEEKFDLDVWYVDHLSLGLDIRILWDTIGVVFLGSGVSADGHATMPRFDEIMARRQGAEDD